jgi:hypothetical protein
MALGGVRVKGTYLQMQQASGTWVQWWGAPTGRAAGAAGTVWVHANKLTYYDNAGTEREVYALDGGLTAQPAGKLWAGTTPTTGYRYFAWIDTSLHSRTGHADTAHINHDDDIAHSDVAHVDSHTDTHTDVAHTNVPHSDSHTDDHGNVAYGDVEYFDYHGDLYEDHTDVYHDGYTDVGHEDSYEDFHFDTHTNIAYVDWHDDVAHSDTAHSNVAHTNTHGDVAHGDHTDSTPAYDDHDDTAHINLPVPA